MVLDPADHDTWSVGSFFTNPVLPVADVPDEPDLPRWPAGQERVKLPAAWLIEHSGFRRGRPGPGGRVGLSTKHVLALSNRGGGTAQDILALAGEVRDGVRTRFGVDLTPEPVLVGCSL
jgi:UDP-N-acetylmuramate dehydrogenase